MKLALPALVLLAACGYPAPSAMAVVVSTFDSDADGWSIVDVSPYTNQRNVPIYGPATWGPTSGVSDGGLQVGDLVYWTHIAAPAKFLGDWSQGYGSTVSFDMYISYTDGVSYPAITLMGLNKTLYFVTPSPVVGQWNHIVIPLTEASCKVNNYLGEDATAQDVMEVLSSVEGFFIMTEWNTGPDDTRIDNVVLGLSPQRPKGLGIRGGWLNDRVLTANDKRYRFTVWGLAQNLTDNGFELVDGSGVAVKVVAPGYAGIGSGGYARATGVVDPMTAPLTVRCDPRDVSRLD